MASLETPPPPSDLRRERRWTRVSLLILALTLGGAALAVNHLRRIQPPGAAPVDHGPLPAPVRAQLMALLEPHLVDPRLEERVQGPVREFHITGRARAPLAREFHAAFRPVVAGRLMPLLRPYGEILSFDIPSLDLPPARLRPLPTKD